MPGAPWLERHIEQRLSSLSFGGPGEAEVRKVSWGPQDTGHGMVCRELPSEAWHPWRLLGGVLRSVGPSCQPALDRAAPCVPWKPNLLPRGEASGTCDSQTTGKGGEKGCLTGCWEQRASGESRARNEWRRSDLANLLFFISTSRQNVPQN